MLLIEIWDVLWKTPLSVTLGGSPEVMGCVASQTPEDHRTSGDAPLDTQNISLEDGINGA